MPAAAQQFVVDDAAITGPGACQLEGWLGGSATWLLPACTPLGRAEITLGAGRVQDNHGDHTHAGLEGVAQVKVRLVPDAPGATGVSVVVGAGFGPFAQATGERLSGGYAYLPLTYTAPGERLLVHANAGTSYAREGRALRLLYGLRADLVVAGPATLIAELFGEGGDMGAQAGLRLALVPDRLGLDASFGLALRGEGDTGPALGLAWTPAPFFRPLR
ncbi:MAG: hypothetical protein ACK41D_10945 [Rubricoccaceae bacterium]